MNKTQSLKNFVYLVGLHIYYKMIHGPYNIKHLNMFIYMSRNGFGMKQTSLLHGKIRHLPGGNHDLFEGTITIMENVGQDSW